MTSSTTAQALDDNLSTALATASSLEQLLETEFDQLKAQNLDGLPLLILCDNAGFTAQTMNNFVWITFTRSNPSHDIYGIDNYHNIRPIVGKIKRDYTLLSKKVINRCNTIEG